MRFAWRFAAAAGRSVKLLEELALRTSKVTPLMKKSPPSAPRWWSWNQRIEELKKIKEPAKT